MLSISIPFLCVQLARDLNSDLSQNEVVAAMRVLDTDQSGKVVALRGSIRSCRL